MAGRSKTSNNNDDAKKTIRLSKIEQASQRRDELVSRVNKQSNAKGSKQPERQSERSIVSKATKLSKTTTSTAKPPESTVSKLSRRYSHLSEKTSTVSRERSSRTTNFLTNYTYLLQSEEDRKKREQEDGQEAHLEGTLYDGYWRTIDFLEYFWYALMMMMIGFR